jgi:hypothetical protein
MGGFMRNTNYTEYLKMKPEELRKLQKTRGWALSAFGSLVYFVLRLFSKPKSYYGICEYFEIGKSRSGMEMGWFFVCGKGWFGHLEKSRGRTQYPKCGGWRSQDGVFIYRIFLPLLVAKDIPHQNAVRLLVV